MRRQLVVVGDSLLDRDVLGAGERLSPDAPVPVVDQDAVHARPGGAGLAAALAAADGRPVTLVTALAPDAAGAELVAMLDERGVEVVDLGLDGATPEKLRIGPPGRPLLRLDRGGGTRVGEPDAAARAAIGWAGAVLVADYGRGVAASAGIRAALAAAAGPVVWDPHPRGPAPVAGVALATPNAAEAAAFAADPAGDALAAVARRARSLAHAWRAAAVCVTCGARGAVLVEGDGAPLVVPAEPAPGGDPCGAGDRFASRAAAALADGASATDAVLAAVAAASRFVAAGGAAALARGRDDATPRPAGEDPVALAAAVRAGGGTVVATGGCFDLLHPGHVQTLETARALGDCLVVCLNGDASVTRLKGSGRPVVGQEDRAAVLRALRCVDAVLVFDEDTPAAALERLRPDLWVKGGDYAGRELPEADVLRGWGGEVVVLPFVDGKSSTRIIEEARPRVVG
ncbi:MAG: D-beta-D-heptose 7-phosphate kinase / D-beta-D-heptose 1-phosphate adenosyltransferase [Solirubrobacteraceae bacterium]|nr:D-beta-D-heptose 7-phosphate kinase / D-beta-D-heptose 1-phosphate adenosyltransferase [Solirubrobacteraceae bacterium]